MRYFLLMLAVVMGQSVLAADKKLIADPNVEKQIRRELKKPTGELTKAELASVTELNLSETEITDAGLKDVAKLQKLTRLNLFDSKITDADAAELKKALLKCDIIRR